MWGLGLAGGACGWVAGTAALRSVPLSWACVSGTSHQVPGHSTSICDIGIKLPVPNYTPLVARDNVDKASWLRTGGGGVLIYYSLTLWLWCSFLMKGKIVLLRVKNSRNCDHANDSYR